MRETMRYDYVLSRKWYPLLWGVDKPLSPHVLNR